MIENEHIPAGAVTWLAAGLLAMALHAVVAVSMLHSFETVEESDELAGNLVVELAPSLTAASTDAPAAALGLLSTEQAESPAVQQAMAATAPDTPTVPPTPSEPDPDLVFKRQDDLKHDTSETTEKTSVTKPEQARDATSASIAAAPPKVEATRAPTPTASEVGLSPMALRAKTTWNKKIVAHLERFKRYPEAARKQSAAGAVLVAFTVARDGTIRDASIRRSSGLALLDDAALDMLVRASPLPAAPTDVAGETFELAVPLIYQVGKD